MAAKFSTQDKDFCYSVHISNVAQTHISVEHAVTMTYERRTYMYNLAKTESDGSEKAVKSAPVRRSSLLPRTIIQLYYTKFKNSRLVGAKMPLSLLCREPKCTSTVYRTCFRFDWERPPVSPQRWTRAQPEVSLRVRSIYRLYTE